MNGIQYSVSAWLPREFSQFIIVGIKLLADRDVRLGKYAKREPEVDDGRASDSDAKSASDLEGTKS
jgi:hypothetical protein